MSGGMLNTINREITAAGEYTSRIAAAVADAPKKLLTKMDAEATVWMGEQVARKGALTMLLTPLRYVEAWYWTCALRDGFVVLWGLPAPPRHVAPGSAHPATPISHSPRPEAAPPEEDRPFMSTARLICDIAIMLPRPGLGVQLPAALAAMALGAGTVVTWKMARAAAAGKGGAGPTWLALGGALLWPLLAGTASLLAECSSDIALNRGEVWAPFGHAKREHAPVAAAAVDDEDADAFIADATVAATAAPGGAGAVAQLQPSNSGGATAVEEGFLIRVPPQPAPAPHAGGEREPRAFSLYVGRRNKRRRWLFVFGFSLTSAGLWSVSTDIARSALETTFANAVASTVEVLRRSAPAWMPEAVVTASSLWSEGPIKAQALGAIAYIVFLALSKVDARDHHGQHHRVRLYHALLNKLDV
jgi:hypothetical protein